MRNSARILSILNQIREIWNKYPDLRLGQLIGNVVREDEQYYLEDNELIKRLKEMYNDEIF